MKSSRHCALASHPAPMLAALRSGFRSGFAAAPVSRGVGLAGPFPLSAVSPFPLSATGGSAWAGPTGLRSLWLKKVPHADKKELWKGKPIKAMTRGLRKKGGRNYTGRITVWTKGGGHKRKYRTVDFARLNESATVLAIEYDPNRSARIARMANDDPEGPPLFYQLASEHHKPGMTIASGPSAPLKPGNALPLRFIPEGRPIHNVELYPGKGGQLIRSAGTVGTLIRRIPKEGSDRGGFAHIRLPSKAEIKVRARREGGRDDVEEGELGGGRSVLCVTCVGDHRH